MFWQKLREFYKRNQKYMIAEILMYGTMVVGIIVLYFILS
jgi:hypothetical protein